MNYLNILKKRRSVYALNHHISLSEEEFIEFIENVTVESPTSFNMQSSHIVILMNEQHHKLWNIVTETLRKIVPDDKFSTTQAKMDMFSHAKGTILFFDDRNVLKQMKEELPIYKDNVDTFAAHSMGILQGNIWNALASVHIGASLQHYNPLIDDEVKKTWNIPENYQLTAQMVFGGIDEIPTLKDKLDAKQRVKSFIR